MADDMADNGCIVTVAITRDVIAGFTSASHSPKESLEGKSEDA
jgi:hypothetical protein